ncbi:hypothetical protein DVH05_002649 [Phytophthora capsici]|nr:hypothetical protein DVH05_002649 [Phytophthora capsici]
MRTAYTDTNGFNLELPGIRIGTEESAKGWEFPPMLQFGTQNRNDMMFSRQIQFPRSPQLKTCLQSRYHRNCHHFRCYCHPRCLLVCLRLVLRLFQFQHQFLIG